MNLDQALITGKGITLSRAFSVGGETALIGMGIVFGVLVILMLVLQLFRVVFYKKPKEAAAAQAQAQPEPVEAVEEEDEDELIAVLTAAIAASLNTSTYNLKIKSYKHVAPGRPSWNRAGINESIASRF